MATNDEPARAEAEQIELLVDLVNRAHYRGLHTGIRNDELNDLGQEQAAELIEQLRRRLGEVRG